LNCRFNFCRREPARAKVTSCVCGKSNRLHSLTIFSGKGKGVKA
jgi:hypothetical protein